MSIVYLHQLAATLRRRRERRAAIKALSALSDTQLLDLGIERRDILALANRHANGGNEAPAAPVQARRIGGDGTAVRRERRSGTVDRSASNRCGRPATGDMPARY